MKRRFFPFFKKKYPSSRTPIRPARSVKCECGHVTLLNSSQGRFYTLGLLPRICSGCGCLAFAEPVLAMFRNG